MTPEEIEKIAQTVVDGYLKAVDNVIRRQEQRQEAMRIYALNVKFT